MSNLCVSRDRESLSRLIRPTTVTCQSGYAQRARVVGRSAGIAGERGCRPSPILARASQVGGNASLWLTKVYATGISSNDQPAI